MRFRAWRPVAGSLEVLGSLAAAPCSQPCCVSSSLSVSVFWAPPPEGNAQAKKKKSACKCSCASTTITLPLTSFLLSATWWTLASLTVLISLCDLLELLEFLFVIHLIPELLHMYMIFPSVPLLIRFFLGLSFCCIRLS